MVWVLLLSMAIPNGGGVAIEMFAYYLQNKPIASRLDSEQFRSAPRTGCPCTGRLDG